MGFMDKAKKLGEQAQQKLDEAQEGFNQSAAPKPDSQPAGVRYDEHGRPVQKSPAPDAPEPAASAPKPASGDAPNATPDPFKPHR